MLAANGAIRAGTTFPIDPTPLDGQLFWRTDLGQLFIFNGATQQWQRIDSPNDHGQLGGLLDDDHPHYLLANGARELTGTLTVQQNLRFRSGTPFIGTLDHNISNARTWVLPDESGQLVVSPVPIPVSKGGTGLAKSPGCELRRTASQSIPDNAWTTLLWTTEDVDTDGMYDAISANGIITFNTPGVYLVTASVEYQTNTTGVRGLEIIPSTGKRARATVAPANQGSHVQATLVRRFAAGHSLSIQTLQNSGGSLSVLASDYTWVTVQRIGEGA